MTSNIFSTQDTQNIFDTIIQRNSQSMDKSNQENADFTLSRVSKEKPQHNFEDIKKQKEYLEIFGDYVNNSVNWKKYAFKKSFALIEDIALIYNIGQEKDLTNLSRVFFTQLLKKETRFVRSAESLRDRFMYIKNRYKKYLCYLKNEDFVQIVSYLIDNSKDFDNGIYGNIIFEFKNGKQQMKEISKQQINFEGKNQTLKKNNFPELDLALQANFNERMQMKKIKLNDKLDFKVSIVQDKDLQRERIVKRNEKFENMKFDIKKQIFQEMFNLTDQEIIKQLALVSGDWLQLFKALYDDKNIQKYQWTEDQDQILKLATNNKDINLQKLIKEKGQEIVQKRIRFTQGKLNI